MYLEFFGLSEKPFALTPNTAFLVRLAPYQACLNLLRVALGGGEGFIKVSGEVGTGKTLLCRALLGNARCAVCIGLCAQPLSGAAHADVRTGR